MTYPPPKRALDDEIAKHLVVPALRRGQWLAVAGCRLQLARRLRVLVASL
jgi:hypothetical protein